MRSRVLVCSESPFPGSWGHQTDIPGCILFSSLHRSRSIWANAPRS